MSQVPPLPGPSQGNLKFNITLSRNNLDPNPSKEPLDKIRKHTCIDKETEWKSK